MKTNRVSGLIAIKDGEVVPGEIRTRPQADGSLDILLGCKVSDLDPDGRSDQGRFHQVGI